MRVAEALEKARPEKAPGDAKRLRVEEKAGKEKASWVGAGSWL